MPGINTTHQCSTPFGITGFGTFPFPRQATRGKRAQRLSASLDSAQAILDAAKASSLCSTPFGITGFGTDLFWDGSFSGGLCSTPFGITGFGTRREIVRELAKQGCSTPFGITGFGTSAPRPLSRVAAMCSTPFGITGFGTCEGHVRLPCVACAQRLSASLDSAPMSWLRLHPIEHVLNAFRHHWIRHRHPSSHHRCHGYVLNAFRHHWIRHIEHRDEDEDVARVLNAFRHHWIRHKAVKPPARRGRRAQRLSASLDSAR